MSFVYVVRDGDDATHFKHAGSDSLELYLNATIKRASTNPTTDALTNLPVSEGGKSVSEGGTSRWQEGVGTSVPEGGTSVPE